MSEFYPIRDKNLSLYFLPPVSQLMSRLLSLHLMCVTSFLRSLLAKNLRFSFFRLIMNGSNKYDVFLLIKA